MTDTRTLISALRILARDIQSLDGVANACISEAADRLESHDKELSEIALIAHMQGVTHAKLIIPDSLRGEIEDSINRHSAENGSDTPDFILAEYLLDCLKVFDKATKERTRWYGTGEHEDRVLEGTEPSFPDDDRYGFPLA